MNKPEIMREYTADREEIRRLCNLILSANQTKSTKEPTWGDVGVLNHVVNTLKDIADFLNKTGEYDD